jgi:curved DNA-binding protein CbpA
MDYYKILELDVTCNKSEIKKKYYELSKKYHPDKNNGDDEKFKIINEAYETLYDDELREKYKIKKYFKNIDFTEEDYELIKRYYYSLINSNEFKLMKLLYDSIPENIKISMWNRFKKANSKDIVKLEKTIDITELSKDAIINLLVSKYDYENNKLKIIHINSKNGFYYLYIRVFEDIILNNIDCLLELHFYIRD